MNGSTKHLLQHATLFFFHLIPYHFKLTVNMTTPKMNQIFNIVTMQMMNT